MLDQVRQSAAWSTTPCRYPARCSFGQKTNESFLSAFACQPWWPARRRLGLPCIPPTGLHRIAPAENTACVGIPCVGRSRKGELLLEKATTLRDVLPSDCENRESHRDTPFPGCLYSIGITYAEINSISEHSGTGTSNCNCSLSGLSTLLLSSALRTQQLATIVAWIWHVFLSMAQSTIQGRLRGGQQQLCS